MRTGRALRPNWKTTALHSAIAALCANGLLVTHAQAVPSCGPTVSVDQGQCTPSESQDILIQEGVTISTSDEAAVLYFGDLGFSEGGPVTGSLTNNGSILSSGLGEDVGGDYTVAGVQIDDELLGTLTNNGVISGTSVSNGSTDSFAFGILEGGAPFMQGTLRNSGTISASSTSADGSAQAVAVYIGNAVSAAALIDNQAGGSISASATSPNNIGDAIGVFATYFHGTLNNDGEITATLNALDGKALGFFIDEFSGTLNNQGTVTAHADGSDVSARGLFLINMIDGAVVNNAGTISGTASDGGEGFSIWNTESEGSSTINNLSSGVLRGRLNLQGSGVSLNNDGVIDLSDPTRTSYLAGDFTQSASGTLRLGAAGDGEDQYSRLYVGGTATIAGDAFVDVQEVNSLAVGQTLTSVVAANNLSGNFAQVEDNSTLFNFRSVATQGEDGYIDFEIVKGLTAVQSVNASSNPAGLGAARTFDDIIDQGTSNPGMQAVIDALGQLGTEQEVSDAVSQTLPLLTGGMSQATSNALNGVNTVVQERQNNGQGRSSGEGFYGDEKLWLKPFGSWVDQDDRNNVAGYDANIHGLVIGADAALSEADRLGVAFAYSRSDVDSNSSVARQSAVVDSYQLVLFGNHALDAATRFDYQLDVGRHDNDGQRDIGFMGSTAKANYDSWSAHLGGALSHSLQLSEQTRFTPAVRADYTWIRDESYRESGAGALNLNVDSRTTDALVVGLDGSLEHDLSERLILTAKLGVGYDLINEQASITSAFAGEPSANFTTDGLDPSPWITTGGLNLAYQANEQTQVSVGYDVEGREDFSNQTVSAKVRWAF